MSDYEPGTVAMATVQGVPNVRVMRLLQGQVHKRWTTGTKFLLDSEVSDIRPLVVLDPPSGVDVNYLVLGLRVEGYHWIAKQIEAQTRPPKPPEPEAFGALIKDAEGRRWMRGRGETGFYIWQCELSNTTPSRYAEIDAVEVLFEGVTPVTALAEVGVA